MYLNAGFLFKGSFKDSARFGVEDGLKLHVPKYMGPFGLGPS